MAPSQWQRALTREFTFAGWDPSNEVVPQGESATWNFIDALQLMPDRLGEATEQIDSEDAWQTLGGIPRGVARRVSC